MAFLHKSMYGMTCNNCIAAWNKSQIHDLNISLANCNILSEISVSYINVF